jgi:transposase-like protein
MASVLQEAYFHDEAAAFAALEGIMWPGGKPASCPHCGEVGRSNRLAVQRSKPSKKHPNGKPVYGLWKCYGCRQQFTVRKGTVFEESRLELHQWFQAAYLLCASKKGVSSNQLHRTLGCTLKTAWFVGHRLREAMRELHIEPLGGEGQYVEADETVIGGKERNKRLSKRNKKNIGMVGKEIAFSLVERGGKVRSHHVPNVNAKTLRPILMEQVKKASTLMTDDAGQYRSIGPEFARYETVNHGIEEYVRGDAHTNTIEGFFSIMKRGINGVYHHVSAQHLKRYLAEFDFRYNNRIALGVGDVARTASAIKGAKGKRLLYRDSSVA